MYAPFSSRNGTLFCVMTIARWLHATQCRLSLSTHKYILWLPESQWKCLCTPICPNATVSNASLGRLYCRLVAKLSQSTSILVIYTAISSYYPKLDLSLYTNTYVTSTKFNEKILIKIIYTQ